MEVGQPIVPIDYNKPICKYLNITNSKNQMVTFKANHVPAWRTKDSLGRGRKEETTTAIVWISLPALPPNFLGEEPVFSMAATTVGKPLHVDMTTLNKTHPSCTRVKVELDMLGEFPKCINVGMRKKSRKVLERWLYPRDETEEEGDKEYKNTDNELEKRKINEDKKKFGKDMHDSEKLSELPIIRNETTNFIQCINTCAPDELEFTGSCYTWWNERIEEECKFKRLDRVFTNKEFMNILQESEVHHLIREGSDYAPLHVTCNNLQEQISKPFSFLNF
ncbi:hypothetical protein H5410_047993 [Solanum commersonii]|uniref:DUF4283 domain-containing protein n=1 Tax=Solanum commersonii TaxID=4109 RepID=A0A9J5XJ04_SOLCO|nr:hypothetical protein H5410_047993 [Solanum commersonii]